MESYQKMGNTRKTRRHTIAIVENDEDLGQVIRATLRKAGFECVMITDGADAFRKIEETRPDLGILDMMMPQVSGYEICCSIRKDPMLYEMPVLMVSALGEEPGVSIALGQGADDYLGKPFDLGELLKRVKTLLETCENDLHTGSITGLPGMEAIKRKVNSKLFRDERIAVGHLELDNFPYYNESYGAEKGNMLIKEVAQILEQTRRDQGIQDFSVGHIGRASFIFTLDISDYREYCKEIISRFERQQQASYTKEDFDKRFMRTKKRARGPNGDNRAPLVRMALGVVTNEFQHFPNFDRLNRVLVQVNQKAKREKGNNVSVPSGCWCQGMEAPF